MKVRITARAPESPNLPPTEFDGTMEISDNTEEAFRQLAGYGRFSIHAPRKAIEDPQVFKPIERKLWTIHFQNDYD